MERPRKMGETESEMEQFFQILNVLSSWLSFCFLSAMSAADRLPQSPHWF